jgi:oligoendopeptidase F
MTISTEASKFIETFNYSYEAKHRAFEENFWATKMNLSGSSIEKLTQTKGELDEFLGDQNVLEQVQKFLKSSEITDEERKILLIFERTFKCYIIQDPKAKEIKLKIDQLEAELQEERKNMKLGYTVNNEFTAASSVQLRNLMTTSPDVAVRKAAYEGLKSIGSFVAKKFSEIVKLRNQFAKALGFPCFYDMKVNQAEGFDKITLFKILDELEARSRPILIASRERLAEKKGKDSLEPYNISHVLHGDLAKLKDPYFPFDNAVDCWARSFAAMGIQYSDATMQLDLCDRAGKYSNGFCHWPRVAWMSPKGWVPSQTNFTSLATPSAVGSGYTALVTLMHEGGHAAHFANVEQKSPLFSQERAPTSVAYAENQSMFLDSVVSDSAWMARYGLSRDGEVIPWDLIEKEIRETHDYQVFSLAGMIAVPIFERRLYELPEHEVTAERIIQLADEIECKVQGGFSPRPLLSVPHILSDESSCYYHGYVLADMSVYQTRDYFLKKYGSIVDNPLVGKELTEVYWKPGNSEIFLHLVQKLTGKPLTGDAWIAKLQFDLEERIQKEKQAYKEAFTLGPKYKAGESVDLKMRVKFVHGDEIIADSADSGLSEACSVYKTWVAQLK